MSKKIIIVGGVAGGASAAARLRRLDEHAEIMMMEKGPYISFANCGLPYYIGETIEDRSKLVVTTPELMKTRFNIDVRVNSEVISVDTKNKQVTVQNKENGQYQESYDVLILAPGAKALKPPIQGIDSSKILTLRNIPDTDRVKQLVDERAIKHAVVIGGGYVGVEMAENFIDRGLDVTLVEAAPHILAPFDSDMVTLAERELQEHGVRLILNNGVEKFNETSDGVAVTLKNGDVIEAEIILLAIGVAPDTTFIKDAGIDFGPRGHILVNENMQTNVENVYAVGDAIEVVDFINGAKTAIPLAGPANKQGRIAADHICGIPSTFRGTQGTAIIKIFGLTGASTGNNERTLERLNVPYKAIYIHPSSHATYYPGASAISLKLLFNEEGTILGAQAFGNEGVDKRIDVIATVIRLNGKVYDLAELELAYAPPFSSAKDPVNMAGFVAENWLTHTTDMYTWKDLNQSNPETVTLVDVRTNVEFEKGNIEGAINIPVDELRSRLHELDASKEIWVYCQVGVRGHIASRILNQSGFEVKNLTGGYKSYEIARFQPTPFDASMKVAQH